MVKLKSLAEKRWHVLHVRARAIHLKKVTKYLVLPVMPLAKSMILTPVTCVAVLESSKFRRKESGSKDAPDIFSAK